MTVRTRILFIFILCLAVWGTDICKSRVVASRPASIYHDPLYIPNGRALKIIGIGFDASLADALWVKSLIYVSDNMRLKQKGKLREGGYQYLHDLFNVITQLSPRFMRAYLYGGLFLLSSGREDNIPKGISLLEKGIRKYEDAETAGYPLSPDQRWLLYIQLAFAYEQQLKNPLKARDALRNAVHSPECPPELFVAWEGTREQELLGHGLIERVNTMIRVWESLLEETHQNKSLRNFAVERLRELQERKERLLVTQAAEEILTKAVHAYKNKNGTLPPSLLALRTEGFLKDLPPAGFENDKLLLLPDGTIRSQTHATMQAQAIRLRLLDAVGQYMRTFNNQFPASLDDLVRKKILPSIPSHPLAKLGYRFSYDPASGAVDEKKPPAPAMPDDPKGAPSAP